MSNDPTKSGKLMKKGAAKSDPVVLLTQARERFECVTKQIEILDGVIAGSTERCAEYSSRTEAIKHSLSDLTSRRSDTFRQMNDDFVSMDSAFLERRHALTVELNKSVDELDQLVLANKQLAMARVAIVSERQAEIDVSNMNMDELVVRLTCDFRSILATLTSSLNDEF